MIKMNKLLTSTFFALLLIFGFVLKFFSLFISYYDDTALWAMSMYAFDTYHMNFLTIPHPPFTFWIYQLSAFIFEPNAFALRIVPIFFSFLTLLLCYQFAKEIWDKKVAWITLFFSLFTYFAYQTSITPDIDTSSLVFLTTLSFYLLYKQKNSFISEKHFSFSLALCIGCLLGLMLLSKVQSAILFLPLFVYAISLSQSLRSALRTCFFFAISGLTSLFIFSLFPLFLLLFHHAYSSLILQIIFGHSLQTGIHLPSLVSFISLFIVMTPLLPGLALLSLRQRKENDFILWIWLIVVSLLYFLLLPKELAADYPRYFAVILPPLILLAAKGFSQLLFTEKQMIALFSISIAVAGILLFINNTFVFSDNYFIASASSPTHRIADVILKLSLSLSIVFLAFTLLLSRKRNSIFFFSVLLFLVLGFSINFFLIGNLFVQNEYRSAIQFIQDYKATNSLKHPIYTWNEDTAYYLGLIGKAPSSFSNENYSAYAKSMGITEENSYIDLDGDRALLEQSLMTKGGTAVLMNYPYEYVIKKNTEHQETQAMLQEYCSLSKTFFLYNDPVVQIYQCSSLSALSS